MNSLSNLRWPVVVVTLAATLALLFGAGFVIRKQTIDAPLEKALTNLPAVAKVAVEAEGDSARAIRVELKAVPDLAKAYKEVDLKVNGVLAGVKYTLAVADQRSPELEQLYYNMHFQIQEALATGNFSQMKVRLEELAHGAGVTDLRVTVEHDRIYVQFSKGAHYLYEVVDRPVPTLQVTGGDR